MKAISVYSQFNIGDAVDLVEMSAVLTQHRDDEVCLRAHEIKEFSRNLIRKNMKISLKAMNFVL